MSGLPSPRLPARHARRCCHPASPSPHGRDGGVTVPAAAAPRTRSPCGCPADGRAPWPGHPDRDDRHATRCVPARPRPAWPCATTPGPPSCSALNRLGAQRRDLPGPGAADPGRRLRRAQGAAATSRRRRPREAAKHQPRKHQEAPHQEAPATSRCSCTPDDPAEGLAAHRPDPRPGAPPGLPDGPPLRRTPHARAGHRLAGVGLAAAPRLQRRRARRDAGDARHRPLDAVVRRPQAAAARHPRQHPGRRDDPAHPAVVDARDNNAIAAYYQGLGAVREARLLPDTKQYVRSVRAHQRRLIRTGSPI